MLADTIQVKHKTVPNVMQSYSLLFLGSRLDIPARLFLLAGKPALEFSHGVGGVYATSHSSCKSAIRFFPSAVGLLLVIESGARD